MSNIRLSRQSFDPGSLKEPDPGIRPGGLRHRALEQAYLRAGLPCPYGPADVGRVVPDHHGRLSPFGPSRVKGEER